MTIIQNHDDQHGVALASHLGLKLGKREGHDLAGPCIACRSSDAFRLHMRTGVAHCFSCGGKWSPFQVAEAVLRDREQAKALLIQTGLLKPSPNSDEQLSPIDPIESIARQKGITVESLKAFGARVISPQKIELPAYGPDGKPCSSCSMSVEGGKGRFAKGNPAGLFFPHDSDKVRLPRPGETWCLAEGPKDAPALHGLAYLACGLNTCRLAAKFARLFADVHVILVPDRDRAGEDGAKHSARVLRGVAKSIRIGVLPAEFKEKGGTDVRDILRQSNGEQLVRQAIEDAQTVDDGREDSQDATGEASCEIELPEGNPVFLTVSPAGKKPQRLVAARRGDVSFRDQINTDSSVSRDRFVKKLAAKINVEVETLEPLIDAKLTELADEAGGREAALSGSGDDEQTSQATMAATMAAQWDLWHTPDKVGYATIPVEDHFENWGVRSQTFKRFVAKQFYDATGKAMNSEALSSAVNLIEAKAIFEGSEHKVHVRLAEFDGKIYIDLCNQDWELVEITAHGWQVKDESPVRFRRSRGMLPLPKPEKGGSVDLLWSFLNVEENAWRMIVAWLLAALRPRGPYPILALFAEQGSGKSVGGRILRSLIDPNSAPLRSEPRSPRDLMISANNSWCSAFDNLSHVPPWLSDALCRLSTGGGFATRELYTDEDEIIFESQRPVLLTSIEDVATRSDLLDRCLIAWLPPIPEQDRRTESELYARFEQVRPRILGALFDAVSGALRELPKAHLPTMPRMADFAMWVTAAERSLRWPTGAFMEAYQGNRQSANEAALESAIVGPALLALLMEQGEWHGSASELLDALEDRVTDQVRRQRSWPKGGQSMAGHLRRLAPNLREAGWDVKYGRQASHRSWSIRRTPEIVSSALQVSSESVEECEQVQSDADSDKPHDTSDDAMTLAPRTVTQKRLEISENDTNDANDTNSAVRRDGVERNDGVWEEGPL